MSERVNFYKRHLKNYKYYQERLKECDDKLEVLYYNRNGVKALRYDLPVANGSQDDYSKFIKEDDLREKIFYWEQEKDKITGILKEMEDDLLKMKTGEIIKKVYCLGKSTFYKEAKKLYVDAKTLKRRIDKDIKSLLKSKS
ncbi:MAG: hypothetical protein IJH31_00165 [Erysipelotrichaceae bacterium]|nr:hypothetical protein [Erysipelotrichaceae bacterium]